MAEWLGNLIGNAPDWLIFPVLVMVIAVVLVWAWLDATSYNVGWPLQSSNLKEKKHDKK